MKQSYFAVTWRLLCLGLLVLLLTTMTFAPVQPANAQESPLPTPVADSAATSPLATPSQNNADAAAPLAGTAVGNPGLIVGAVVGVVVVGGLLWQYRRSRPSR